VGDDEIQGKFWTRESEKLLERAVTGIMKFIGKITVIGLALFWILSYIRTNFLHKAFIFDRNHLQDVGREILAANPGANSSVILGEVYKRLREEYGDYINEYDEHQWVFNNAGNAMGSMYVLHASISEYLIFFGTAVGTEGHTGTHFAEDYFLILAGTQTAAPPHAREAEVYFPGDSHHLPCGYNKQYHMPADSWALELAQGWIPTMLPFGFLEALTSTMDFWSLGKTVKISAVNIIGNLLKGKL
jgi:C-8 sterol isomerase